MSYKSLSVVRYSPIVHGTTEPQEATATALGPGAVRGASGGRGSPNRNGPLPPPRGTGGACGEVMGLGRGEDIYRYSY